MFWYSFILQFADINFEPGGKAHFKGNSYFVLQPSGVAPGHIFGLLLTEDSNVMKFKETIDNLIQNLSVRPRMQQPRKFLNTFDFPFHLSRIS